MRIALAHEYLNQFGGAERTLQVLSAMFPDAPIYTLFYDPRSTGYIFEGKKIVTSFLQNFPFAKSHHQLFPLLMPLAIEQFDFSDYDIVLSISASFAKGIVTKPNTKHICYCLTPPRFLWDNSQKLAEDFSFPSAVKKIMPPFISYLRIWDREAAMRVDEFWSISNFVKSRVTKYYNQDSKIIYPPVNLSKFKIQNSKLEIGNYYLMVGRLVSYKKFDLAVEVFNKLGWNLKIVGIGPEMKRLKKMSRSNIEFLGQVPDEQLAKLYQETKALIFPQEEDFGIVPLECMASGRPVVAYRSGGAEETILEGKTGLFFDTQDLDSLQKVLLCFNYRDFDPQVCRKQAVKFSVEVFRNEILRSLNI